MGGYKLVVLSRFSILLEWNFSFDFLNCMTCEYFLSFSCSTRRRHERKPLLQEWINKTILCVKIIPSVRTCDTNRGGQRRDARLLPAQDLGINPTKMNFFQNYFKTCCFFRSPVSDRICPSQYPVDEAESSVGEADHDGVDDVTHPHRPRNHTEVKQDTRTWKVEEAGQSFIWNLSYQTVLNKCRKVISNDNGTSSAGNRNVQ